MTLGCEIIWNNWNDFTSTMFNSSKHSNKNLVTKNFGEKFCENIKDQLEKSFEVNLLLGEALY